MAENPELYNLKRYSDGDITKCRKAAENLKMASIHDSVARRHESCISGALIQQCRDIKYIDDDNDNHNQQVLLKGENSLNKTPLKPLTLETTSSPDNLSHLDCVVDDDSANNLVKTRNKTKNGTFSLRAHGSEDEAISNIFDEVTNKLDIPQTLLSLIQYGESLGYDKDNHNLNLKELYRRYGPEILSSKTGSKDDAGLFNALLHSYHPDNLRNRQDIRKENQEEVTVNAASNKEMGKTNNAMLPNKSSKRRNNFKKFCEETNLNGWYFMSKKNTCSRIFWSLVIIISIALACTFCFLIISEFLEANIIITIDSVTSNLDKVVFPSIIVCNQNKVSNHS
jgi:hypothetical protein